MNLMHLPAPLQQDLEKWAASQGMSVDDLILDAVTEKLNRLNSALATAQDSAESQPANSTQPARLHRKDGILVIDVDPVTAFDTNAFIDELREERIRDQMAL